MLCKGNIPESMEKPPDQMSTAQRPGVNCRENPGSVNVERSAGDAVETLTETQEEGRVQGGGTL